MERNNYKSELDKYEITYDKFYDNKSKNKTFVIIHGKNEYSDRYHTFAKYLLKNGHNSYIINLRGHGHTGINNKDMGYFKGKIKKIFLSDIDGLIKIAKKENPNHKIILLGHSMGSYITRYYISKRDKVDGYICVGTTYILKFFIKIMKLISFFVSSFKGKRESKFLTKILSSKSQDKYSKEGPGAWLTHDKEVIKEFFASPLAKSTFKSKTIYCLAWLLNKTSSKKSIKSINHKMPIFLISGDEDTSSKNGALVEKLYDRFKKQKLNVEMKLYKNMRHEIIQETKKEKVFDDILKFVEKNI